MVFCKSTPSMLDSSQLLSNLTLECSTFMQTVAGSRSFIYFRKFQRSQCNSEVSFWLFGAADNGYCAHCGELFRVFLRRVPFIRWPK